MLLEMCGVGRAETSWRLSRKKAEAVAVWVPLQRPKVGRQGGVDVAKGRPL